MYDTGSTDLILPAKGCTTCGNDNLFDPAQSTSFSSRPGDGVYTLLDYSTAASTVPVVAGSDSANCTYVTDVVTLHGLESPEQTFAICNLYPSSFENVPMDGILGLGISPQAGADSSITPSFWSWYNSGLLPEPVFSFDLIPRSEMGAVLTLGETDHSKYTGEIAYINLDQKTTSESHAISLTSPLSSSMTKRSWSLATIAVAAIAQPADVRHRRRLNPASLPLTPALPSCRHQIGKQQQKYTSR